MSKEHNTCKECGTPKVRTRDTYCDKACGREFKRKALAIPIFYRGPNWDANSLSELEPEYANGPHPAW